MQRWRPVWLCQDSKNVFLWIAPRGGGGCVSLASAGHQSKEDNDYVITWILVNFGWNDSIFVPDNSQNKYDRQQKQGGKNFQRRAFKVLYTPHPAFFELSRIIIIMHSVMMWSLKLVCPSLERCVRACSQCTVFLSASLYISRISRFFFFKSIVRYWKSRFDEYRISIYRV